MAISFSFAFIFAVVAFAQSGQAGNDRKNVPGQFDFYVLALSWSPSFCEVAAERTTNRKANPQCGGRSFAFVVHGLWPQYEHGFPAFCQKPAPWVDRGVIDSMLDLMPDRRLIIHEWQRHGTCSGLSASEFFSAVRKASAAVKIPPAYADLEKPIMVSPGDVAAGFLKANPGLSANAFTVTCDSKRLSEVRVCLDKSFSFRDCPEVTRHACKRDKLVMPAMRGS